MNQKICLNISQWVSLVLILFLSISNNSCTNEPTQTNSVAVVAALDTTEATIGDVVTLSVLVENPGEHIIQFPAMSDSLELEVRCRNEISNDIGFGIDFQLAPWDTGRFVIPPYPVNVLNADSALSFVMKTSPLTLTVNSVLSGDVNTELRPLKEPVLVTLPLPWRIILLILIFILLLAGIVLIWRQRIPTTVIPPQIYDSTVPPDVSAMERLNTLNASMDSKELYVQLSFILREYVENSFFIKTLEMTTPEIMQSNESLNLPDVLFSAWIHLLTRADLIKYAKEDVLPNQKTEDLKFSLEFVEDTRKIWALN